MVDSWRKLANLNKKDMYGAGKLKRVKYMTSLKFKGNKIIDEC